MALYHTVYIKYYIIVITLLYIVDYIKDYILSANALVFPSLNSKNIKPSIIN